MDWLMSIDWTTHRIDFLALSVAVNKSNPRQCLRGNPTVAPHRHYRMVIRVSLPNCDTPHGRRPSGCHMVAGDFVAYSKSG